MRDKDTNLIWEIFTSNKEIPPILTVSPRPENSKEDPDEFWHHHKKKRKKVPKVVEIEGNLTEDGNKPLRLDDSHILDDIKDLPLNYVKGMGLVRDLEKLEALPSGQHWSIGHQRREITKRIKNDLGSGLDRYYGQKESGGGLVAKVIPGSSIYMDADIETRRILPSETGKRAITIFFAHRKEILDYWTDREETNKGAGDKWTNARLQNPGRDYD